MLQLIFLVAHNSDFLDMIINSIVRGLIYGVIFKLFYSLEIKSVITIAVTGLIITYVFWKIKRKK